MFCWQRSVQGRWFAIRAGMGNGFSVGDFIKNEIQVDHNIDDNVDAKGEDNGN